MGNRRRLTAKERLKVYEKCKGHCAYCGCEIPFKEFHVDHVKCLRKYEYMDEMEVDGIANMLPACKSCNLYKSTFDLEQFREWVQEIPKRLARDVSTYSIGIRFGLIQENQEPIKFYFEKLQEE